MDSLLCLTKSRFTAKFIPPPPSHVPLSAALRKADSTASAANHCQGQSSKPVLSTSHWRIPSLLVIEDVNLWNGPCQ